MTAKWFLNPTTGKTVQYPEHFAELKPYLVPVDEAPVCEDCMIDRTEDAGDPMVKGEETPKKAKNERS